MAQQEVRQVDTEGFVPPLPKIGEYRTLQISVSNTNNYIDLQYGDHNLEDVNQAPQRTNHFHVTENPLALN